MINRLRTTTYSLLATISLVSLLATTTTLQAAALQGFGALKFGMTPAEVEALEDCSSRNECLYDLLGKNRYFTLGYGPRAGTQDSSAPSGDGNKPATLSYIDIELGTYTQEWFVEIFEVLASQYSLKHQPTDTEQTGFQQGDSNALVIGFADGFVLLKVVRRPFGNMIIHMIFQDAAHAQAQRALWDAGAKP